MSGQEKMRVRRAGQLMEEVVAELRSEKWDGPEQVDIHGLDLDFILCMLGSFQRIETWGM